MQPLLAERKRAVDLRKLGLTYSEIRQKVKVSKSSLSIWLREVGLAKKQIQRITQKRRDAQKYAIQAVRNFKIKKTQRIKTVASAEIGQLSDRERWVIGIALYWAEGSKEKDKAVPVAFSNSDPNMIIFFRDWSLDFLKIPPYDIHYQLYIHERAPNIHGAIRFWSELLEIDPAELVVRFKKHNPSPKRKNTGNNYKGLIRMQIRRSTDLNRRISGWVEGLVKT